MIDRRDLVEAWATDAAALLAVALPSTFAGHIPDIIAALAPSAERLIGAMHGGVPTATEVVYRDHPGTRLAAENPDLHRAQVAALGKGG